MAPDCTLSRRLENTKAILPFLLVGLLIGLRNPTPLVRSELWAEDALVFFAEALNAGWHALYTPVYGYHFLLSRVIAWIAAMFPVVAAPYVYAWSSLAVNAVALGYFSQATFAWIIPSRPLRLFVCLLLVLAPGGGEVMMNLCNLMTPLTLLAVLVLLESPGHLSWGRFGALLILAASAGPVFLLSPLVAYLAWRTRSLRYMALIGAMLPIFILNVIGNHVTGSQNGLLNYSYGVLIPMVLADNFALRLFVLPIAGINGAAALMAASETVFWSVSMVAGIALAVLWRLGLPQRTTRLLDDQPGILLLGAYSCAIMTFAGIAISRSYAVLQILRQSGDPLWQLRYSYLPGALAVIIWVLLGYRLMLIGRLHALVGLTLLATLTTHELGQWSNVPSRRDIRWPDAARVIQDAVDRRRSGALERPVRVSVPVHPSSWRNGAIEVEIVPSWSR